MSDLGCRGEAMGKSKSKAGGKKGRKLARLTFAEVQALDLFNGLLDAAAGEARALLAEVHTSKGRDARRFFTVSVRRELRASSGACCWYCGAVALDGDADHVIPWARGGRSTAANARWACRPCNLAKSARVW